MNHTNRPTYRESHIGGPEIAMLQEHCTSVFLLTTPIIAFNHFDLGTNIFYFYGTVQQHSDMKMANGIINRIFCGSVCSTPKLAIYVSIYHTTFLVASIFLLLTLFYTLDHSDSEQDIKILANKSRAIIFVFLFGILGGTLHASREVVKAVRRSTYESRRLLWQVLTPVHGGVLAIVSLFVVAGGLVASGIPFNVENTSEWFIGGFAFVVGFSAELFVKALIRAAEGLFNEKTDRNDKEGISSRHPESTANSESTDRQ